MRYFYLFHQPKTKTHIGCIFDANYPFLSRVFQEMSIVPSLFCMNNIIFNFTYQDITHEFKQTLVFYNLFIFYVIYKRSKVRWFFLTISLKKFSITLFHERYCLLFTSNFWLIILSKVRIKFEKSIWTLTFLYT